MRTQKTKRWLGIPEEQMMNLVVSLGEGIDTMLTITENEEQFNDGLFLVHQTLAKGIYKDLLDDRTWERLINAAKRALWHIYEDENRYEFTYGKFYNLVKKYYK